MRAMSCLRNAALAMLAIAVPGQVSARPAPVRIELRHDTSGWVATYIFTGQSPAWFFPRTKDSIDGVAFRSVAFRPETPGVSLARLGHYDGLYRPDGRPLRQVRIAITPFITPLRADYPAALTFSDGGIAFYSNHFSIYPAASPHAITALPDTLDDTPLERGAQVMTVLDPGHDLLVNGHRFHDKADLPLDGDGTYVYVGRSALVTTPAFAAVIDPGLPSWARGQLDDLLPRLMELYTQKLGVPAGNRPTALIAWEGTERPGVSMQGSVMKGQVIMALAGQQMLVPNPKVLSSLRWFFGHETAHFWMGQTVRYSRRSEGWITEGSADLLAMRAMQRLVPDYDPKPKLQEEMTNCLKLNAAGKPLAKAEARGEEKAYYACGALLLLVAEAASQRQSPGSDAFTFIRRLIDDHRSAGVVTQADWLAQMSRVAGPQVSQKVGVFIDQGVPDPQTFWMDLFASVGLHARREGATLVLLP